MMGNKKVNFNENFHCNFFPKNRKASHIGMMISFIVFILFLIFIFIILEPSVNLIREKENYFEYLEKQLIEKFSSEMITISVDSPTVFAGSCIKIDLIDLDLGNGGFVISDVGNYNLDGTNLNVDLTEDFIAYYSEGFDLNNGALSGCEEVNISFIRKNNYIFKSKIEDAFDLENFEAGFNLTGINDFSFELLDNVKENIVGEVSNEEISSEVVVKDVSVEYVDTDANINVGYLRIKIW